MIIIIKATKIRATKTTEINEINEITKIETNEIKARVTKAERGVNLKIRISIIIFIMKESREKRASI